jgi:hypothetical protein
LALFNQERSGISPSKTSFLLWEWKVFLIWFYLVFMLLFDFVFILLFTLYFPTITHLTILFYYYLFLFTVFYLDFNKIGCPSKISMPPFLTVSHQPRSWGTF